MDSSDKQSSTVIPQTLLDCIIRGKRIQAFVTINQEFEGFSLVDKTFAAKKNATSLKGGQSAFGVGHPDITDDKILKPKRKRKLKLPSIVARDRARRQIFWKQKKSVQTSLTARQQQRRIPYLKFSQNKTVLLLFVRKPVVWIVALSIPILF